MRKIKNISVIFFAAFFLLATNGVNLIRYCCNLCEEHGTEILTAGCHESDCCKSPVDNPHQCEIKRYTLTDGELTSGTSFSLNITAIVLPHFLTGISDLPVFGDKNFFPSGYVYDSGRSLLSYICVLTI
jgi:hypothetical protein